MTSTSNLVTEAAFLGLTIGSTALAAAAIAHPIGAAGGAVFGCFSYLVGRPVQYICEKAFNTNQPTASTISKIVSIIASCLIGVAAAWGLTLAVGIKLTFLAALIISLVAIPITLVVAIPIIFCGAALASR